MRTGGIILAGGSGRRFGSKTPKQFALLNGKPLLRHSVDKFLSVCDSVVVVVHPEWMKKTLSVLPRHSRLSVCPGGPTRQLSSLNGLLFLKDKDPECGTVAIHDGARPLFSVKLLRKAIALALKSGSAVPVVPVASTLCAVQNGRITGYSDRDGLFHVQTPQVFRFSDILKAHLEAKKAGKTDATDDSSLFEKGRRSVDILPGEASNIKITTPQDLAIARGLLKKPRGGLSK